MSVRKKGSKLELIDELKAERLSRRKAKAIEERAKNIKKIRRARLKGFVLIVIAVILAGVVSGAIVYNRYSASTSFNQPVETAPQFTETASEAAATEQASINRDGYVSAKINGMSFAYPSDFSPRSQETETAVYKDESGDGTITFGTEMTSSTATELMKAHQSSVVTDEAEFKVDGSTYIITGAKGDNIYHRYGCVADGVESYYEFVYPSASAKADKYAENIEYIDKHIKHD